LVGRYSFKKSACVFIAVKGAIVLGLILRSLLQPVDHLILLDVPATLAAFALLLDLEELVHGFSVDISPRTTLGWARAETHLRIHRIPLYRNCRSGQRPDRSARGFFLLRTRRCAKLKSMTKIVIHESGVATPDLLLKALIILPDSAVVAFRSEPGLLYVRDNYTDAALAYLMQAGIVAAVAEHLSD
jgi:hypothetical protein